MNNTLLDNSEKFLMRDVLKDFIASGKYNHICIATGYWDLPGTALVYDELKSFLEKGGRLDILIGQEPQLRSYQKQVPDSDQERFPDFYLQRDINLLTDEYRPTAELILRYCKVHKYEPKIKESLFDFVDDFENQDDSQIQIRVYGQESPVRKQFLHAKCYIFLNQEEGEADGIIGSSNFTEKGLEDNAELNYLETNNQVVASDPSPYIKSKSHKTWFEEKWDQSVPWNGQFLQILTSAPVAKPKPETEISIEDISTPLTPYELYIKLLQYKFGDLLDVDTTKVISSYLPSEYSPLEYQLDAVKQCFGIMRAHGGFMLADVVGLGKTIVGTLIIKFFLNYPDDGRERKVLIVTPPAIRSAWIDTIRTFDKNRTDQIEPLVDFITTGSIGNLVDDADSDADTDTDSGEFEGTLKYNNYGLIIIDESHKFRNSDTAMYESLNDLIAQIGANTGGNYPYIGLLSATPQNNTPNDLKNQIYLFERNHQYCTLEKVDGRNLEVFFSGIMSNYTELRKEANAIAAKDNKTTEDYQRLDEINEGFKQISGTIRDTILCDILVRRTRTDIKKFYEKDMKTQHLVFPQISGPHSLKYKMDNELAQLFADTMDMIAPSEEYKMRSTNYLNYYRYRAIQYLSKTEDREKYKGRGSRDADNLADQLAKIMQILLVKRLESSFSAFTQSLLNLRTYTENMIKMWENDSIFICPQIDVNAELDEEKKSERRKHNVSFEDCIDDIRKKIDKRNKDGQNDKGQNAEYTRADFDPEYIKLIKADYKLISKLYDRWTKNSADPKFDEFKESLKPVLFNPEINRPQKLVIFSEAKDTVKALARACENKGFKVLCITASNRDDKEQEIKENFDANYKGEWKDNYQVIITTEVLAEGINLHRANVILNYDTPWNSTRLMQRIGRVNRIGSKEPYVYVYNFMPSAQGDSQIQLVEKAHIKLQSFHTLFGEDSKIFTEDETVQHYDLNDIVNGEESPYEKYLYELKAYRNEHPGRYAVICQKEDDLQLAVQNINGDSYFVVRTPKMRGLFVRVDSEGKGKIVSGLDFYPAFLCDVSTQRGELPKNWESHCKTANRTVGQHLAKLLSYKVKDTAAINAKSIIDKISKNGKLSEKSQNLLIQAFNMINKGNSDIIRIVNLIGNDIYSKQLSLFKMEQDEIDAIIARKLDFIDAEQAKVTGTPEVFIGIAK